jgi:hypothetical protein
LKPNVDLITVGVLVSSSTDQGFALLASNGDQLEVMVNKDTKYFRKDLIVKGDIVLVFGERRGRVVFAGAVRELAKEESRYMR